MKKITFLAIACLFALTTMASWDGTSTSGWTGDGTETSPYLIENENQLAYLAQQVNSGTNYSGKYFQQTADFDLGGVQNADGTWSSASMQWIPIGNKNNPFKGHYDGDGHSITNLYINATSTSEIGLFGYITDAEIKKINIASGEISGYNDVAALCGFMQNSTIFCCSNEANVKAYGLCVAGICGITEKNGNSSSITYCTNYGRISGETCGGICGKSRIGDIAYCLNLGQIFGSSNIYNGNISGIFLGNIDNCFYDKQLCTYLGAYEQESEGKYQGLNTQDIIGSNLSEHLTDNYTFTDGLYPCLTIFKDNNAVKLGTIPLFFNDNETADSILSPFITSDNAIWTTNSSYIEINNNNVTLKEQGGVSITAKLDVYEKKYTFSICNSELKQNGTKENPLEINSFNDLKTFRDAVNNNSDYKGYANHHGFKNTYFTLTTNIDLGGTYDEANQTTSNEWIPIGNFANTFHGHFDGNYNEISNLYINTPQNDNIGFFGNVNYGSIKNLTITSGQISGNMYVGCICGNAESELIENCTNYCNIINSSSYVGCIVGLDNSKSEIKNCVNYGSITQSNKSGKGGIGGICGYSRGATINCYNYGQIGCKDNGGQYVAGICGNTNIDVRNYLYRTRIDSCENYGDIYGTKHVGGIVGRAQVSISNCKNTGTIQSIKEDASTGIGGIVGLQETEPNGFNIVTYCVNNGKVISELPSTGGIVGNAKYDITSCINNDTITSTKSNVGGIAGTSTANIDKCLNLGYITGANYIGGTCGNSQKAQITNTFNAGNIEAKNGNAGGIVGNSNNTICQYNLNIGRITASQNPRSISGNVSNNNSNNFSDLQMFPEGDDLTSRFTKDLISNELEEFFGSENWTYAKNLYPCPKGLENNEISQVATSTIILYSNDTDENIYDDIDSVTRKLSYFGANRVKWRSTTNAIGLMDSIGFISLKNESQEATVIAQKGKATKTIKLTIAQSVNALNSPELTWDGINDITYGTVISKEMLNAKVADGVYGQFYYSINEGTILEAGNYDISVTFVPETDNYNIENLSFTFNVLPATPELTWEQPENIKYGTAINETQLNAQTNVEGTYIYTNSGAILPVGTHDLTVTFIPTSNSYKTVSETVQITVTKATPEIIWATPSDITYGEAITNSMLNAVSLTEGTFTYSVNDGDILNAGNNQIIATLDPDSENYESVSSTITIYVKKAMPNITWTPSSTILDYGTYARELYTATSDIEGDFTYSNPENTVLNAGKTEITVTFTPKSTNYETISKTIDFEIKKAKLIVSVADTKIKASEKMPQFELTFSGFVNNENIDSLIAVPIALCNANTDKVGIYDIEISGGASDNYEFVYQNGKLTIEESGKINDTDISVEIYPNPTNDILNINCKESHETMIFDNNGRLIMVRTILGKGVIDISNQPDGVYYVIIGNKTTKIIKE